MTIDISQLNKDTNVRYLDNTMLNAPALTNTYGDLVKLLKTVLVDGFNEQPVTSTQIVEDVIILTLNTGHGFLFNQVVELSGALEDVNGFYRVLYSDSSIVKIKLNNLNINSLTGTISLKVASLGYQLVYDTIATTGTACFKNTSTISPAVIKVIDAIPPNGYGTTWTKFARVVAGQEVDSNGEFINNEKTPYHSSYPYGEKTGNGVSGAAGIHSMCSWYYAQRASSGTGTFNDNSASNSFGTFPTNWKIIGDSNTFYLFIQPMGRDYSKYNICSFGLYQSQYKDENFNIYLVGSDGWVSSDSSNPYQTITARRNSFTMIGTGGSFGLFLFKNIYGQTQHWLRFIPCALKVSDTDDYYPFKTSINNISPLSGDMISSNIYIKDINNDFRGKLRGIELLYGSGQLQNNMMFNNNEYIILQTKLFEWTSGSTNDEGVPYLFSFKNWEL